MSSQLDQHACQKADRVDWSNACGKKHTKFRVPIDNRSLASKTQINTPIPGAPAADRSASPDTAAIAACERSSTR